MPESTSDRDISHYVFDRLHRIHHHFVGPKTAAETLPSFFEDLTRSQAPSHLFAAGWVAIESALQASSLDNDRRLLFIQQAKDVLELGVSYATERADKKASERGNSADYSYPYQIAATLAYTPLLEELSQGKKPTRPTVLGCYQHLRRISELTARNIEVVGSERPDATGALRGLLNEFNTISVYNRVLSTQYVALPTMERADDGSYYRETTHDIQVLHLKGSGIVSRVPVEAKASLTVGHSNRYESVLVGGDRHLRTESLRAIVHLSRMLQREFDGTATQDEIARLDEITQDVFHLHRHYHRRQEIGRHCLNLATCAYR